MADDLWPYRSQDEKDAAEKARTEKAQRRAETAKRIQETYGSARIENPTRTHPATPQKQKVSEPVGGCMVLFVIAISIVFLWFLIGGIRYMWDHPPF